MTISYQSVTMSNDFERHLFRKTRQLEGETLDQYCTQLWQCAETCGFTDVNSEIKLPMVDGVINPKLPMKGLKEGMTLDKFLEHVEAGQATELDKRRTEVTEEHLKHSRAHLSGPVPDESVNAVRHRTYGKSGKPAVKVDKPFEAKKYFKCGGLFPHKGRCRAKNWKCRNQYGHYTDFCSGKRKSAVV